MEVDGSATSLEQVYSVNNLIQQPTNGHQNQLIFIPPAPQNALSLAGQLPHSPQQQSLNRKDLI